MTKNLVIVESPAKAKTIEGYLGKDFTVRSSYGHVRDLPNSGLAIDIENGFKPDYVVSEDKQKVVDELKNLAKTAEIVWLATDEDREGEAISWHLLNALELEIDKTRRIVFSEITKKAILSAIEKPRKLDIDLVNAQQARRILDRLVGFELSPVLWKKVRPSLSAGRVQSVAVRIVVEREREIEAFSSSYFFNIRGLFDLGNATLKADLQKKLKSQQEAEDFIVKCVNADFSIVNIETKPSKKSPSAPFTTSTLQQEAGRKLGFSVAQTMVLAQRLYESGKITYMRTDSVNLSDFAIDACRNEINASYGEKYAFARKFTTKSKGAQEAHEAIRPTEMVNHEVAGERNEQRLYDLIWKRTIASQMADAELEKTTASVGISTTDEVLQAKGEVIRFDGFLKVYMEGSDEESDEDTSGMLPPLSVGQKLVLDQISGTQRFSQKPPRYTEASLVKRLEELGIGRPSTYAPTISTVQQREYVVKKDLEGTERKFITITLKNGQITKETKTENTGAEKSKLFPTDIGKVVTDFLVDQFPNVLDYSFTAKVEEEFDDIAAGKLEWQNMLKGFYTPFHANVEDTLANSKRATGERELGTDPTSGKPIFAKIGRFGPMIQIGIGEDEEKKFAALRPNQSIGTITLEDALELFKLPRTLGVWNEKNVVVGIGRFGPYVKYDNIFASLRKNEGDDPMEINLERAIKLVQDKLDGISANELRRFDEAPEIRILKGKWGPYIKSGDDNYKLPKGLDPTTITLEEIRKTMEEQGPPKPKLARKGGYKAAAKKGFAKKGASKKAVAKKSSGVAKKAAPKKAGSKKAATKKKKADE
ncbi:MAG: type I DNA topoisomerase [Flavobacteriales bacterium]|nr:type I DNA topoisomerase [Flavobacteriales bacterium]